MIAKITNYKKCLNFKLIIISIMAFALNCMPSLAYDHYINVNGQNRHMIVYAPSNLPQNAALVISMHGYNQDAGYQQGQCKWNAVADTAKFVVVYPDGLNRAWDTGGNSDIDFLQAIINEMVSRHGINKDRCYLNGFSMGGMMTYHVAMARPKMFAAYAPVSGYPMDQGANSSTPVPLIHTHGTGDDVCNYGPVEGYVKKWVNICGCNQTPITISPYPSNKPGSVASLYRWTGGKDGTEVALLKLAGKGHWFSEDGVASVYSSVEIWNFCKRYPAGADAPSVKRITPEDNSFDLPAETSRTYTILFDSKVDPTKMTAQFVGKKTINMTVKQKAMSATITLNIPADAELEDGNYRLVVKNVVSEGGGILKQVEFNYIIGITDVDDFEQPEQLLNQDWASMRDEIGEGIPYGWKRVNSNSDGSSDEKGSGEANTGGVRLKYFSPGGDMEAGMYISARDYQVCNLSYGTYDEYRLGLTPGKYRLTFKSIYWTQGASDSHDTFSMTLKGTKGSTVLSEDNLPSSGCLADNADQQVKNSYSHEYDFTVTTADNYILNFSYAAGWNGIIIGDVKVETASSIPQYYKGGFKHAYAEAVSLYDEIKDTASASSIATLKNACTKLKSLIDQYADFTTTAPSKYQAAIDALNKAISAAKSAYATGINAVIADQIESNAVYDMSGRKIYNQGADNLQPGLYIINGKKYLIK